MKRKAIVFFIGVLLMLPAMNCAGASASQANLALGKSYIIESGAANEYSFGHTEVGNKEQLTDGKTGNPTEHYGGAWSHFVRAISRTITVDLERVMSVDSFETAFIQRKSAGIYCPKEVVYSISENGEDYMTIARVANSVDNMFENPTRVVYRASADKSYKARYVRVYFDVNVNTFLDEIFVFGSENINNAGDIAPDEHESIDFYYDSGESIGAKDIVCFHYGYWPDDETLANNAKDVFKNYIGYTDTDGNYADTMFDAVMFLIIQGKCPSGGNLNSNGPPAVLSDWEYLIENTFGEDINLNALEQATSELKEALGLPEEHRTTVYLSAPHPKVSDLIFGDYNGDGVENKIESLEDCVSVYSWYIDEVLRRYNEQNYKHIELKGFFWSNESLSSEHFEQEPEYAALCVKALHERGMQCIFIPFYQATGIEKIREIGFDATIMQANLSFNEALQKNPEKMMEDFAYTAGKYHTGIQMEVHDAFIYNVEKHAALFNQYLVSAVSSGLMTDAVHAYYQGAGYGVFHQWAVSADPAIRWFYDATYKFIKGTLEFPEFKVNTTTEITVEQNKFTSGTFEIEGDWSVHQHDLSIAKLPKHGILFVDLQNGSYNYRSDRKYAGEDSFVLKYTNPDGEVVEVPVSVTVTGENTESNPNSNGSMSGITGNPIGWILSVVAAGITAAAVVALLILRSKNKRK